LTYESIPKFLPGNVSVGDRSYFEASRLGPKRAETPEGFLIIYDVPIARTGIYVYGPGEIMSGPGEDEVAPGPDGLVRVYRSDDEVFHPDCLSSFEGKDVVNDHPQDGMVGLDNWRDLTVGVVQNVRRGSGLDDEMLIADFIIKDRQAIEDIKNGKIQVSCGYSANYEIDTGKPGYAHQRQIRGNHVAIVETGRCGARCAIGDSEMEIDKGKPIVPQVTRDEGGGPDWMGEAKQGQTININVGGGGLPTPPKAINDETAADAEAPVAAADAIKDASSLDAIMDALKGFDARLKDMEGKIDIGQETAKGRVADEDKDKDDEDCKKSTADSAATYRPAGNGNTRVREHWQDTIARGEILFPGIKIPAFDATMDGAVIQDSLCKFRRKALELSWNTEQGQRAITPLLDGENNMSKMTCDAIRVIFTAASDTVKTSNIMAGNRPRQMEFFGKPNKVLTPADINRLNREHYGKK
jgi:hypothetical protein